MARHRRNDWLGFGAALALLSAGCGDDVPGAGRAQPRAEAGLEADEEWVENTVPEIAWVRLEPSSPAPGGHVTARVQVDDPDGDELEYGFAWRINGRPVRSSGDTLELANVLRGDPISVTVTVSDGWDESDAYTATAVVGNTPPLLQSVVFDPLGQITRGQPVTARPIAQDPDGDELQYEYKWWVNGRELSQTGDALDTSRLKRGDLVEIEVVASDGHARSGTIKSDPIRVANSPPRIVSTPANAGDASVYLYQVRAEDPDGDRRLRFRLEEGPPGMTIDPITGSLSWAPPSTATGTQSVEVLVDDLQGGQDSQRFTVVISEAEPAPAAPVAAAPEAREASGPAAADGDR